MYETSNYTYHTDSKILLHANDMYETSNYTYHTDSMIVLHA